MTVYTVRPGDTVFQIARSHGVSMQALAAANGLTDPDRIIVGQSLVIPGADKARSEIVVNGYCYPTIRDEMLDEALKHLTFLSVFSCPVSADGALTPMAGDARVVARAKTAGVRPHMVIANIEEGRGFRPEIAQALLENPAAQTRLLASCVALMKERGYTGLDVDFEYVPAAVKENLNAFLAKARAWMHDEGFLLTSAVPAKIADDQPGLLYEGFDFRAQGKYNDFVTLMTYDFSHQGGPPGAVAPIDGVRRAVEYAKSRMPDKKILMGIPNYGYDWRIPHQPGTSATVVQNPGAVNIAARHGAEIQFDQGAQTPWFRYTEPGGQRREVWFEDARSIQAKLALVRAQGIGGVSYWTVNLPFAANWTLLEGMFRVKKM